MVRLPLAALAVVATLVATPSAALAQDNGTSVGQPEPDQARHAPTDDGNGSRGAADTAGPASSSAENKGTSPVGTPEPLAGSTLGKR